MPLCANVHFVFAELLPHILDHSSISDLIKYRLVSRPWKEVATKLLLSRRSLRIQFELGGFNGEANLTFYSYKSRVPDVRTMIWFLCSTHLKQRRDLFNHSIGGKTLPNLFRLITTSYSPNHRIASSLPVDHFDFYLRYSGLHRNPPQLLSFVQVYGSKIKSLTLDCHLDYFVGVKGMPNFILQYTPNLESLCIRESNYEYPNNHFSPNFTLGENTPCGTNKVVILEHLKSIEIKQPFKPLREPERSNPTFGILTHLLKMAPQLRRIHFDTFADLKLANLFLPGKISLLHMRFLALEEKDLFFEGQAEVEKLANAMEKSPQGVGLKLFHLHIQEYPQTQNCWRRSSLNIRRILEANLNSLNQIKLFHGGAAILYKIQGLSALPNVTTLSLVFMNTYTFSFENLMPGDAFDFITASDDPNFHGNSLSLLFPNLETVELSVVKWWSEEAAHKWLPFWNDKLVQVKTLKVNPHYFGGDNYFHKDHEGKLTETFGVSMRLCPEIENFETFLHYSNFLLSLMQPIWNLAQITSLRIKFFMKSFGLHEERGNFVDLDAALTGLSKETVSAIYNNWEQTGHWETPKSCTMGEENWQKLRVNSSILNLQNLKKLHLEFFICGFDAPTPEILISGVSAKFGFDLMTNLDVLVVLTVKIRSTCPVCPQLQEGPSTEETWMNLHRPLSLFSNVTLKMNLRDYWEENYSLNS